MKRNFFLASVATIISTCLPSMARTEVATRRGWTAANVETSGWPKPSWYCASAVVWLDVPHHVYYRKSDSRYGRAEQGAYTCEAHARKTGNRAG